MRLSALLIIAGLLQPFRPPLPYGPGHRGIDLTASAAVTTPLAGQVSFVGQVGGVATIVISEGSVRVSFQPVTSRVRVGQHVQRGEVIGVSTSAPKYHCSSCLHMGVRVGGEYVDPLKHFGKRLQPVGQGAWID